MRDDSEGQKAIALDLFDRFHAMKTYGKNADSLESIIRVFTRDLSHYSAERVLWAIAVHAKRSPEFPTVADIDGLIKRGGRQPVGREVYIAISKKDPELRDDRDWAVLREYESDMREAEYGSEIQDAQTLDNYKSENIRLRQALAEAQRENTRLGLLALERRVKENDPLKQPFKSVGISLEKKVENTVRYMQSVGASQSEIDEFVRSMGQNMASA